MKTQMSGISTLMLLVSCISFATTSIAIGSPLSGGKLPSGAECPADVGKARSVLESFLFPEAPGLVPAWQNEKLLGKNNPIISGLEKITQRVDIEPLSGKDDGDICASLNRKFSRFLTESRREESRGIDYYVWDVVYYKAKGYYFAVVTSAPHPQPNDPSKKSVRVARDRIAVFNSDLQELHTYVW